MKPLRILAIEDDEVDLMSLKRALREIKLVNPVEHAVDGVEGGVVCSTKMTNPMRAILILFYSI